MDSFEIIETDLANEINEIESALTNSYNTLELVSDEGLVDFYTYLIKAYEAKHRYLMRKLKKE